MKMNLHMRVGDLVVLGALGLVAVLMTGAAGRDAEVAPKVSVSNQPIDRNPRLGASFAPVIKRVAPSVVNIYSTRTIRVPRLINPFTEDPFFRHFFGDQFDSRDRRPLTRKAQSLGSGVIISDDGYILTNYHVVEGADPDGVKVALADGKEEYTAKVVGTDPQTEVAVLKIDAKKLPAITLADSEQLQVGDVVLAIGNPFGVGQSVSMGIVSATGRGGFGVTQYEDFIQTDAAINPGNSGGPLVDSEGRLIGINTFIVSGSGASAGVGFAIPVNLARNVMDRLVTGGTVKRGYLGVGLQPDDLNPEMAKAFNLPDQNGALVTEVRTNSPAEAAGLENGDVIIAFNGKKVADNRHLRLMVSQTAPGTKTSLRIVREGREKDVAVTLGEQPEDLAQRGSSVVEPRQSGDTNLDALDGVEVADLDAGARQENNMPPRLRGALVTSVNPGSAAAEGGLRTGDVILSINREAVRNADEAVDLARKAKTERLLLRVWSRQDDTGFIRYLVVNNVKRK